MRKLAIALAISLLPIFAISPANAEVCTYKSYQVKIKSKKPYTYYEYKTKRVCR